MAIPIFAFSSCYIGHLNMIYRVFIVLLWAHFSCHQGWHINNTTLRRLLYVMDMLKTSQKRYKYVHWGTVILYTPLHWSIPTAISSWYQRLSLMMFKRRLRNVLFSLGTLILSTLVVMDVQKTSQEHYFLTGYINTLHSIAVV